jgi:hypothetical protein
VKTAVLTGSDVCDWPPAETRKEAESCPLVVVGTLNEVPVAPETLAFDPRLRLSPGQTSWAPLMVPR